MFHGFPIFLVSCLVWLVTVDGLTCLLLAVDFAVSALAEVVPENAGRPFRATALNLNSSNGLIPGPKLGSGCRTRLVAFHLCKGGQPFRIFPCEKRRAPDFEALARVSQSLALVGLDHFINLPLDSFQVE